MTESKTGSIPLTQAGIHQCPRCGFIFKGTVCPICGYRIYGKKKKSKKRKK